MKINFIPQTKLGKWALWLTVAFFMLFIIANIIVAIGGAEYDKTWYKPIVSLTMMISLLSAVAAFFTGVIGIAKDKEKGILTFLCVLVGLLILIVIVGEFISPN